MDKVDNLNKDTSTLGNGLLNTVQFNNMHLILNDVIKPVYLSGKFNEDSSNKKAMLHANEEGSKTSKCNCYSCFRRTRKNTSILREGDCHICHQGGCFSTHTHIHTEEEGYRMGQW